MKKIYPVFFAAIVFSFSAMMLIFSLLCSIKIAAVNDSLRRTQEELAQLSAENESLRAGYESAATIEQIESYALDILGMQRCTASQIEYVSLNTKG